MYNSDETTSHKDAATSSGRLQDDSLPCQLEQQAAAETENRNMTEIERQGGGKDGTDIAAALGMDTRASDVDFDVTIQSLLQGARANDEDAIAAFFRRYATAIFCYFKRRGISHEEAKDLTIGVFLKVLNGSLLHGFRLGEPFRPFLITVLTNRATDYWRHVRAEKRATKGQVRSLEAILDKAPDLAPFHSLTPEDVLTHEYYKQIHKNAVEAVRAWCEREASRKDGGCSYRFTLFHLRYLETPRYRWPRIHEMMVKTYPGVTIDQLKGYVATATKWYMKSLIAQFMADGYSGADAKHETMQMMAFLTEHRE